MINVDIESSKRFLAKALKRRPSRWRDGVRSWNRKDDNLRSVARSLLRLYKVTFDQDFAKAQINLSNFTTLKKDRWTTIKILCIVNYIKAYLCIVLKPVLYSICGICSGSDSKH